MPALSSLDRALFAWIVAHRSRALDPMMIGITFLGRGGAVWLALAVVLSALRRLPARGVLTLGLALLLASLTADWIVKPAVRRERPFVHFSHVRVLTRAPDDSSFPSGHAANAFAGAIVFSRLASLPSFVWWTLASAIAYSRIYLGVHYPLDVLGGAVVGMAAGALALMMTVRAPRR